jgi:D-alanyl-D-alanine carboxypeptidase
VTGSSLTAELRRRVLQPLQLRATTFDATASRITARHAHGYRAIGPRGRVQEIDVLSSSLTWAAGALVATAGDVARFYRALLQGRLLRPELVREMETTVPAGPPGEAYGLGLFQTRRLDLGRNYRLPCADSVWGHDGSFAGWVSYAYNSLDGRRQMVILINTDRLSARGRRALGRLYATAFCA